MWQVQPPLVVLKTALYDRGRGTMEMDTAIKSFLVAKMLLRYCSMHR